jgi:cell division protein FtsB
LPPDRPFDFAVKIRYHYGKLAVVCESLSRKPIAFSADFKADTMGKKKRQRTVPFTQIITIVVATMAISMIVDFGRKATANYRVRNEERRLEQEIAAEGAKHQALLAHRAYVQTDEYVEQVAREELKWVKPGEIVVVPVPLESKPLPTPETPPAPTELVQREAHWQAWWSLFFDRPPPEF